MVLYLYTFVFIYLMFSSPPLPPPFTIHDFLSSTPPFLSPSVLPQSLTVSREWCRFYISTVRKVVCRSLPLDQPSGLNKLFVRSFEPSQVYHGVVTTASPYFARQSVGSHVEEEAMCRPIHARGNPSQCPSGGSAAQGRGRVL